MSLIEQHYQHYLVKVELKESEMPEDQKVEIKRAFMAGMSEALIIFCAPSNLPQIMELDFELKEYWNNEIKRK